MSRIPAALGWGPPARVADLRRVKDRTRLTFPPNTVLEEGFEQEVGMSYWFIARVHLPRTQVRSFLSQSLRHSDWQSQEIDYQFQNGFHFMRERHWPIPSPHKFQSTRFEGTTDPASGCAVLIDLDDPQIATVYVYFYY